MRRRLGTTFPEAQQPYTKLDKLVEKAVGKVGSLCTMWIDACRMPTMGACLLDVHWR